MSKAALSPKTPEATSPTRRSGLARASQFASRACLGLAGGGLVLITLIILWQVFARYVLNASPSWSEQLALYVLVWTVLLAAAAGVREGFHIRITALQNAAPEPTRTALLIAAHIIVAGVGVFLGWYGLELVAALWAYPIPTLGLPRGSAFLPLPIAGVLIGAFSVEHIAALLHHRVVEPTWR